MWNGKNITPQFTNQFLQISCSFCDNDSLNEIRVRHQLNSHFFAGYVWRGTSPYMLGGMEGKVYKSALIARNHVLKNKKRYKGYTRLEDGTYRINRS